MTPLIGIWRLFPVWVWTALAGVAACIIIGFFSYQNGKADERAAAALRMAEANAAAMAKDAQAKEAAAAQRAADAIKTEKLTEELHRAVQALPDTVPSDRRRALACARLRSQGTDTSALPACR